MQVSTIINSLKYSEAFNLSVIENLSSTEYQIRDKAYTQIFTYINQALIELNKRFYLNVTSEVINTIPSVSVYTLRENNVIKVIEVYDSEGKALKFPFVNNDDCYDIKELSYNSFMLPNTKEESLTFVYLTSFDPVITEDDFIDLPDVMLEVIVMYVVSKCFGTLGGANKQDYGNYMALFEKSCADLEQLGYGKNIDVLSKDITHKGFV